MNHPRSHTFASCRVVFPPLANDPTVALGLTRANVTHASASPPEVGTSRKSAARQACGNRARVKQSLFYLSGFT